MSRTKGSKNKPKESSEVTVQVEPESTLEVKKEDDHHVGTPHHVSRSALLKEINDTNKERSISENGEEEHTEIPEESEEEIGEEPEEKADVEEHLKEEQKPVIGKHKFKIDGKEVELTEEQIIERVQKSSAADARLAEATRLLEDAKRTAATLRPEPSNLPPVTTSPVTDVGDDAKIIDNITQAVLYGDGEQVANAFKPLLGRGRQVSDLTTQTQGMTAQQVQGYVAETLAFERGKQILETPADQGGYADVWSDTMLRGMFQRRENELRDSKDNRSYVDLYKAVGDEIRQWRDKLIEQYAPQTGLEGREKLKASTGIIRSAGGKVPTTAEMMPKTHEDKLDAMRQRRGLN